MTDDDRDDRDDAPREPGGDVPPVEPPTDAEDLADDVRELVDGEGDGADRGDAGGDADAGVPDSDPRHLDPAGDIADAVERGEFDIELADDQDESELRAFVERAEAGEFDLRADPGLEATVRIVRALLEEEEEDGDA